jgi:hypothetical protein
MSRKELVDAYLDRRISRRHFVKRLIDLGVSVVAAGAFAQALATDSWAQTAPQAVKGCGPGSVDPKGLSCPPEPRIIVLDPNPDSQITDRTPVIRARVWDSQTELTKSNIRLFFDGRERVGFTYDQVRDILRYEVKRGLSFGRHNVKISVRDGGGNQTIKLWSFRVIQR